MTEEQVFLAALELPNLAERQAYLDKACGGDAEFRSQVEALLAAHFKTGEFLDEPLGRPMGTGSPAPVTENTVSVRRDSGGDDVAGDQTPDEERDDLHFLGPTTRPDSLGRIGHYEVLEVLGKGGFGIVFRAFDELLQRVVAIKVMAPAIAATSPARRRFLREAQSSAKVRHENVVQIYAVEEHPLPYLVMEYVAGETLQQRLDRIGPIDVPEILQLGRQIAEGLAAAHDTGLIHRDIKPGNIMLANSAHPRVKITDFGLARAADDASLTQSGVVAGTPMYMSPEQARGDSLDHRSDLFSLGSVMYVMASGRPPFRAATTFAVLKRVVEEEPRAIKDIIPEMPQWLCDVIARLQAKKVEDRFQSAREVADLLADCEAKFEAKQEVKNVLLAARKPARWRWVAAAVVLLPVIALSVMEFAGVTHLFGGQRAADPIKPGGDPTPIQIAKQEPPLAIAPFDVAQAKKHQETWAKHLGVDLEMTNSIGMKLRLIPPGEFRMGSTEAEVGALTLASRKRDLLDWMVREMQFEAPQRQTQIPQPFFLGACEVTVADFRKFALATKYRTDGERSGDGGWGDHEGKWVRRPEHIWKTPGPWKLSDQQPVVHVSWHDAQAFCQWLSEKEGVRYALPEESQWEFAARAGTTQLFGASDEPLSLIRFAWTRQNLPAMLPRQPQPVATKAANAFGLYDMLGNAWEWCAEWHPAEEGKRRLLSGGGWNTDDLRCRPAHRGCGEPDKAWDSSVGFRVALVGDLKPFTVKQKSLPPTFKNSIGMEFVIVPKGKSWLGGGKAKPADKEVVFPADFYLGKYEITQEEWQKVTGKNPSAHTRMGGCKDAVKDISDADLKRFPVEHVSRDECQTFVDKLNKLEREPGWEYRLPTELEWEYACRGGPMVDRRDSTFDFYFAKPTNTLLPAQANFDNGLSRPCKVGSYEPNVLGLFDMLGNVGEWCEGWEVRGAGFQHAASDCRAGSGGSPIEFFRSGDLGLRLARVRLGVLPPEVKTLPPLAVVPFDAAKAREHQEAWARSLGTKVEFADKKLGMEFRVIPPGDFQMGAKEDEVKPDIDKAEKDMGKAWKLLVRSLRAETPRHPVRITRPFALGKYEVTVRQFMKFVEATGHKTAAEQSGGFGVKDGVVVEGKEYNWKNVGYQQADLAPVWNVSRDDAVEFCKWLSKEDGRTFRLPTEAEWEWACRAGTDTRTYWDGERPADALPFAWGPNKSERKPQPVGGLTPNAFGLHDMCGNVWEWCADWFSETYYKDSPVADPPGPPGPEGGAKARHRVQRGGGVDGGNFGRSSTARSVVDQAVVGFRVVCEIAGPTKED